jgi:hypothetical protein
MPKMIQLRRVPDDVYTVVKEKAEQAELSISDYLVKELTRQFGTTGADPTERSNPEA